MIEQYPVKQEIRNMFHRQLNLTNQIVPGLEGLEMEVTTQKFDFVVSLEGQYRGQKLKVRATSLSPLRAFLQALEGIKAKMLNHRLCAQMDHTQVEFATAW